MELFKLFGTIAINNQEANRSIDETTGNARDSQSKISSAFKKIGTAVVTYFAVEKIVNFGKACLDAAANAQAMESQFTQVFGDLEGDAANSLSKIAEEAGIAENRMKGSFTQIAAFAKTTGMETEESLALTERAMVAVADSAAFYDRTLEETTESLQSFLKGNYENDAALGLSCTETTRNAAANALYGKSFIELSEAQKQLTLLQMVEDANALSGAMGQAARESDTWTNQTGNLKQAWTDFTAAIGEYFLPVAIQVVTWLSVNIPKVQTFVVGCMDKIKLAINALKPTAEKLFADLGILWQTVLQPMLNGIITFISGVFTGDWKKAWEGLASIVTLVWQGIWGAIKGILNNILGGVETWINGIIDSINRLIEGINRMSAVVRGLLGIGTVPTIGRISLPRLEEGGILEKGQIGFLEGNGAEAVVPLDQNRAWISALAKDMEGAGIGGNSQQTQRIIDLLEALIEMLPESLKDAFASMKFDVNNREFARLVKAVG